jgi:hypothetical protein
MARKVPTAVTGDPQKIEDLLPKNRADYLNDLGLRYSYDEAGRPMLLSYGRSSVTVESGWSAGRVERAIQNAKDAAATLAESTIIEFMNTNVEAKQELSVGKINEIIQSQTTTFTNCTDKVAQPREDEIKKIINTLVTTSTAKSSGSLQGTSVVDTWEMKDDLGTLQVGSVVTWTYSQLDDAKKIEAQSSGINTSRGEAGTVNSTSRPSRIINKLNDF